MHIPRLPALSESHGSGDACGVEPTRPQDVLTRRLARKTGISPEDAEAFSPVVRLHLSDHA